MPVKIKTKIGAIKKSDGTYQHFDGFSQDVSLLTEEIADHDERIENLENAPAVDAPVKSVSAKGTTLAPDVNGNVDIPSASADTWGLVETAASYGTTVNSGNGKLAIASATNAEIDAKSSKYKPIVPYTIDHAVRAGLISNSQITEDDKADICRTIGAAKESDFELIESITLSSEQDSIVRTAYPDGTPYRLKNAMVFVQIPGVSRSGTNIPRVRGLLNGNPLGYINAKTIYSNTMYCYWAIDIFNKNYMIQSFSGDYNDTIAPTFGRWPNNIGSDYIDGVEVYMYTTVDTKYPVGTKIDIFGVKA